MANALKKPKSTYRLPATLTAAFAVTAVTASIGIVGAPAHAEDPAYPSWDDVNAAKNDEAKKQAEIASITNLIAGLQTASDEAQIASMKKAEAWRQAKQSQDDATQRATELQSKADVAGTKAKTSKMRAGLLAAHLAKAGGGDVSTTLMADGGKASDLLYQLGAMTKLAEQSQTVYDEALADERNAQSLSDQARVATAQRETLTRDATAALKEAQAASAAAQAAVETQEAKSTELIAQLAVLKDTTVEVEAEYLLGEQKRKEAEAAAAAKAAAEKAAAEKAAAEKAAAEKAAADAAAADEAERRRQADAAANAPDPAPAPAPVSDPDPDPVSDPVPAPAPAPSPEDEGSSDSGSDSGSSGSSGGDWAPSGSQVDTAINFAMAQLGDEYVLGGEGPDQWDCSGLTKFAYAAAGVYIGTHSATNQYNFMSANDWLVPIGQAQRGDLMFWGGGGDYYHVAIYLGDGLILEAPDYGKPVRVHSIWGSPAAYVGRPTGG